MDTIEFSEERKKELEQEILGKQKQQGAGYKSNPDYIVLPDERELKAIQELTAKGYPFSSYPPEPFRIQDNSEAYLKELERKNGNENLEDLAKLNIEPLPEDATTEQITAYNKLLSKKNEANKILSVMSYMATVNKQSFEKDFKEWASNTQITNRLYNMSEPLKKAIFKDYMLSKYKTVINQRGLLPDEILFDERFLKCATPEAFYIFKGMYDTYKNNIGANPNSFSASFARQTKIRILNQKLVRGELTQEEYDYEVSKVNIYGTYSNDESEVWASIGSITADMVNAVKDNPALAITGAGLALLTAPIFAPIYGGFTAGAAVTAMIGGAIALPSFVDSTEQMFAQTINEVRTNEKEAEVKQGKSVQQIIDESANTVYLSAGIDSLSDLVAGGIVGSAKKIVAGTTAKVIDKVVNPSRLRNFSTAAAKAGLLFAGNTATQIGTEGLQDALISYKASKIAGLDDKQALEKAKQSFINTSKDVAKPLAVLTALGLAPGTSIAMIKSLSSRNVIEHQTAEKAMGNIAKALEEQGEVNSDRRQVGAVFDLIAGQSGADKRFLSTDNVKTILDALGTDDLSVLGDEVASQIKDALEKGEYRDDISISVGSLNALDEKVRDAIYNNSSDIAGGMTEHEAELNLDEEQAKNLTEELKASTEKIKIKINELAEAQQDMNYRLFGLAQNKNISDKHMTIISDMYSSFLVGMSKVTGMSIKGLHSLIAPQIRVQNETIDITSNNNVDDPSKVSGAYTKEDNTITISAKADFATLFHEISHFYFSSLVSLVNNTDAPISPEKRNNINNYISDLRRYTGLSEDVDLSDFNNPDVKKAHEKLVAGFMSYVLAGVKDPQAKKLFNGLKRYLASYKNASLYKGMSNKEIEANMSALGRKDRSLYVSDHYKETVDTAGFSQFPPELEALINTLFRVEQERNRAEAFYSSDTIINKDLLADPKISEETKKGIRDREAALKDSIEDTITETAGKELNVFMHLSKKGIDIYKRLKSYSIEKGKDKNTPVSLINKFKKILSVNAEIKERLNNRIEELKNEISQRPIYTFSDTLRQKKIRLQSLEGLPHKQDLIERLRRKGFVAVGVENDGIIEAPSLVELVNNNLEGTDFTPPKNTEEALNILISLRTPNTIAREVAVMEEVKRIQSEPGADPVSRDLEALAIQKRVDLGNIERKALAEIAGTKDDVKKENELIVRSAKESVGNTRIKSVDFKGMATRASVCRENLQKSLSQGVAKITDAISFSRQERFHLERTKNAKVRIDGIKKSIRRFMDVCSRTDKTLAKNGYDVDTINLVRAVLNQMHLGRYYGINGKLISFDSIENFGQRSNEELCDVAKIYPSLAEFVRENITTTDEVGNIFKRGWDENTISELEYAIEKLDANITLARSIRTVAQGENRVLLQTQATSLKKSLLKHKDKSPNTKGSDEQHEAGTDKHPLITKFWGLIREYAGITRRIENMCVKIDLKYDGSFTKYIFRPVIEAYTRNKLALNELANRQTKALNMVEKFETAPIIEDVNTGLKIKDKDGKTKVAEWGTNEYQGKTTQHLLGTLWSLGTNYEHFINNWISDDYGDFHAKDLAVQAWLNKMIEQGHITKGMFRCIEELSTINKDVAKRANRASYLLKGYRFKELPSKKWTTPLGTFEIGYAPLIRNKYDVAMGQTGDLSLDDPNNSIDLTTVYAQNSPSFTKDRLVMAKYRNSLSLEDMMSATARVLTFSEMQPSIVQVYKLLNLKTDDGTTLRGQLNAKFPSYYESIEGWLKANAMMKDRRPLKHLDSLISKSVGGVGRATMAGNLNNAVQGLTQIFSILTEVPPTELLKAVANYFMSPRALRQKINEESDYMRLRYQDVNDGMNTLFVKSLRNWRKVEGMSYKSKAFWDCFTEFMKRHAYFMQKYVTDLTDTICYEAVRNYQVKKLTDEYMTSHEGVTSIPENDFKEAIEKEAKKRAEARTRMIVGSLDLPSISAGERGTAIEKMFLQFGSFFFTMAQLLYNKVEITCKRNDISSPAKALLCAYHLAVVWYVPAVLTQAINELFTNQSDDSEDNEMLMYLGIAPAKVVASAFPYIGKPLNTMVDEVSGRHYYNSTMLDNPLMTFSASTYRAGKNIFDVVFGEDRAKLKGRDVKAVFNLMSIITGNSMFAMSGRPISYATDLAVGNVDPISSFDLGRGLITGIASTESKKK